MPVETTWLRTRDLEKKYSDGKYKGQRKLAVAALFRCETPETLDALVKKLNARTYRDTVRARTGMVSLWRIRGSFRRPEVSPAPFDITLTRLRRAD